MYCLKYKNLTIAFRTHLYTRQWQCVNKSIVSILKSTNSFKINIVKIKVWKTLPPQLFYEVWNFPLYVHNNDLTFLDINKRHSRKEHKLASPLFQNPLKTKWQGSISPTLAGPSLCFAVVIHYPAQWLTCWKIYSKVFVVLSHHLHNSFLVLLPQQWSFNLFFGVFLDCTNPTSHCVILCIDSNSWWSSSVPCFLQKQ